MNIEEIFDNIADKSIKISRYWEENKIKSKYIIKDIEYNFFSNKNADFVSKLAYFYALDKRINTRYNNILKILFRFFQWKKETNLLNKIKQFLKCPTYLDSQSIILQKTNDYINGSDCFGSDNNNNGLQLHNKNNDKTIIKDKKETCKPTENAKNLDDNKIEKNEHNSVVEDGVVEVSDNNEEVKEPQYYNINQDSLDVEAEHKSNIIVDGAQNNRNVEKREHIEIPKEDLLKADGIQSIKNKSNIKSNGTVNSFKSTPNTENLTIKNTEIKNTENLDTIVDGYNNNNILRDFAPPPEASNNVVDINLDVRQDSHSKTQVVFNANANQNAQTRTINNDIITEQQKNEIVGEEISKMSEKDIQAIKEVMQAELDRQMNIAEENGDVHKMPISIKEAISPTTNEKSEVQTNKTTNSVLNNKK